MDRAASSAESSHASVTPEVQALKALVEGGQVAVQALSLKLEAQQVELQKNANWRTEVDGRLGAMQRSLDGILAALRRPEPVSGSQSQPVQPPSPGLKKFFK